MTAKPMAKAPAATVSWRRAQQALRAEVERVTRLLRSVRAPSAPALGDWTVAEVAMHLSQAWVAVPGLAQRDLSAVHALLPGLEGGAGASLIRDMWDLGDVTRRGVASDPQRDLSVLADRIGTRASEYLAGTGTSRANDLRPWLVEGAEVSLCTLTCHLLSETIVHGWDIARADGQPWSVKPAHAALVIDGFLMPVFRALGPRDLVNQELAAGLRATYEIRVRGGGRHVLVFDDGALTVEPPSSRQVDCCISADPAALLLVVWGREHQARAIVERRLVVSGPKAWLGPRLRSLMRNP
ncbi:MAG: SCP2 sterol-binding domain-containing protein [Acidimicrobiales bacterium]